ncbi:uncharacterized protein LOC114537545 [Dendronephthya gigantea]|uniref:uncharacterized protein LOC114537545 n=1 Tax=Dendronephthya gigantea TaxID=151771 RepID=UPI00106C766C|nr:uncharacterized protein LOC114537545 [Dendronephthya gigantea]
MSLSLALSLHRHIKHSSVMSSNSNRSRNEMIFTKCQLSYIVESPSEIYINSAITCCVVNAILLIIGCILNSLVVVIYSMSKQLRSNMKFLPVLVLCSVDLVTVTLVHPVFLMQAIAEVLGSPKCLYKVAYMSVLCIFPFMSVATLLAMNVERYIAVVWPLWHLQSSNKERKFMLACGFGLLLSVANFSCRLYKPQSSKAFTMGFGIIVSLITLFVYISIFYVAQKRYLMKRSEEMIGDFAPCPRNRMNFMHNLKIAKIYFLVVILSSICLLPVIVVTFAVKYPLQKSESRRLLIAQVYMWTNILLPINSTLNCLVFFWANARLRKEAWKLWRRLLKSPSNPNVLTQ